MTEIHESIFALEQKLSELIENYKRKENEMFPQLPNDKMSFNILAEELKEGIVLLNSSGEIEYCNRSGLKIFHALSGAKHYKKLLSHFAESKQLFEFEKNIESFAEAHSIKKNEYTLDFISLNGGKNNMMVKLRLLDYSSSCNLLLIFYIDENLRFESETKGEDLFFDELGLLEKKAENLLNYTDELKKTKEQLKESNSKKDKFFNIIAHDLRAPFNSILGLTEMLKLEADELSPEEVADFASRIHNNSKNVLEMVDDLLNWARMQTNHIEYNPKTINMSDVVFDTLYLLKLEAASKGIIIKSDMEENIFAYGDQNMISLVLRNLVSNAIKFTNRNGTIIISVSVVGAKVKVSVQDDGVGIKPENLKKILAIEEHYTKLGTNNEKGTGLGLILCREFLSKNNSQLLINSTYGVGSTFSFELSIPNM